jgi:hypothetical protein
VPSARLSTEITVREPEAATPLVVRVFPAQRRSAVDDSPAITTVSPPGLAAANARSTVSCGTVFGLTYSPSSAVLRIRTCRKSAVAHRGDLPRLALTAVEGAAEHVGLRAADRYHRVPEVRRGRLVGDVPQLAVEAAVPDPE